jgi:hypothetical protein
MAMANIQAGFLINIFWNANPLFTVFGKQRKMY